MAFEGLKPMDMSESTERKRLRVSEEIQTAIMGRACAPDEGQECFMKWIDNNAEKFIAIYEKAIDHDPKLIDKWEENKESYIETFMSELEGATQDRRAA